MFQAVCHAVPPSVAPSSIHSVAPALPPHATPYRGAIMKQAVLAALFASALFSSMPIAVQADTYPKGGPAQTAPDVKAFDKQLAEAQAQMRLMQEQMDRIRQTQDPQERQRLLQEHWATMQKARTAMHGMWGPGMMGGPGMMNGPGMRGWGGMHGYYSKLTPEQMKQRQYMMEQYMGTQQMMMDHMMQWQEWMAPAPPATK
jgi:hypothetical protein